jgi:putative ABC transport system permease protein
MHNYLPLILKNAVRSKRRSFLTVASMATSLCVLGLIFALYRVLFIGGDETPATAMRLIVHHKVSLTQELPASFEEIIRKIPGVKAVTSLRWLGGTYKDPGDPKNHFAQFAIEPQEFLRVHPEINLSAQERQAFLTQKTAAIATRDLATKLHWQPGERITIVSSTSTPPLTLDLALAGVFDASNEGYGETVYFNQDYLEDSLPASDKRRGMTQQYHVEASSKEDVALVAAAIDSTFAESPAPTLTENERAFMLSFISFIGSLKVFMLAICSAVTFTIVLVSANAISMSVRERTREVAIFKTLGYSSSEILQMILGESLFIGLIGGVVGCLAAEGLCVALAAAAHSQFGLRSISTISMTPLTVLLTLAAAAIVAVISAAIPARSAARTSIIDALAYTG